MEIRYYTKDDKEELANNLLYIPNKFKKYLKKDSVYWVYI